MGAETKTGGRDATPAVIPGRFALSVGNPELPLPGGWSWRALGDLARLETGHTPSRQHPEYWDGSIPWVGVRDATGNHGRVIMDTAQHVSTAGIENSSARLLPTNTVCLSRTASVGYVVVMGRPMATSQDFVNWVCGPELDYRYLKYVLLAEREALLRFAHGSVHQTIYFPEAKSFHVALPPRPEQERIADVLWSLDDKIECNRRLAAAADELWMTSLRDACARSRSHVPLSSLARFVNGRNFTKGAEQSGRVVVRITELRGGVSTSTVRTRADAHPDNVCRAGDVLFAWSGSLTVHRWFRPEAIVNQHIFKVIPGEGVPPWLIHGYLLTLLPSFQRIAADKATTMGHIQRHHLDAPVPAFDDEKVSELSAICEPLWRRALQAEMQGESLAELRDWLLPRLLSGEIMVPEAKEAVDGTGAGDAADDELEEAAS